MDQSADVAFSERGAQQRLRHARSDLEFDRLQRAGSDFLGQRRGQGDRPLRGELGGGEAPQQRPREVREAWIGADQVDRSLHARGADHARLLLEDGLGDAHPRDASHFSEEPFREAVGAARVELKLCVAHQLAVELGDRVREAGARDLGGEQQRHADGDSEDREALLYEHRAGA